MLPSLLSGLQSSFLVSQRDANGYLVSFDKLKHLKLKLKGANLWGISRRRNILHNG